MKKYEYKLVTFEKQMSISDLNKLGDEGWKAFQIITGNNSKFFVYLEREIMNII